MMGSFLRTGNYPIEANYIFSSIDELTNWANDPENKAILHEGLLKIVKEDPQSLYWVVEENEELKFVKLIDNISINTIDSQFEELINKLNQEIEDRKSNDISIWGTDDINTLPIDYNNIVKIISALQECLGQSESLKEVVGTTDDNISEYLQTLDYKNLTEVSQTLKETKDNLQKLQTYTVTRDHNLQQELDQIQVGVGLSGDGSYNADQETNYLKEATSIMNSLRILDSLLKKALNNSGGTNIDYEDRISKLETTMIKMEYVTQSQYDALTNKDHLTNYAILNNGKIVKMYTGIYEWDICKLWADDLNPTPQSNIMYYGYIVDDTLSSYNKITQDIINTNVALGNLKVSNASSLSKTSIGIVPSGAWMFIAVPQSTQYLPTKDNGIGQKVKFDVDDDIEAGNPDKILETNGNVILNLSNSNYLVFGEYSTIEGERFIYID